MEPSTPSSPRQDYTKLNTGGSPEQSNEGTYAIIRPDSGTSLSTYAILRPDPSNPLSVQAETIQSLALPTLNPPSETMGLANIRKGKPVLGTQKKMTPLKQKVAKVLGLPMSNVPGKSNPTPISPEEFSLVSHLVLEKINKILISDSSKEKHSFIKDLIINSPFFPNYKSQLENLAKLPEHDRNAFLEKARVNLVKAYENAWDDDKVGISRFVLDHVNKKRYVSFAPLKPESSEEYRNQEVNPALRVAELTKGKNAPISQSTLFQLGESKDELIPGLHAKLLDGVDEDLLELINGELLVAEKATMGSLDKIIPQLNSSQKFDLLLNVANGIKEMHNANLIHADVASRNVLIYPVEKDSKLAFEAKLADFGNVRELSRNQDFIQLLQGARIPIHSMPIETLTLGQVNKKTDVFSFGILMLETVMGVDKVKGLHADNKGFIDATVNGKWEAKDIIKAYEDKTNMTLHPELQNLLIQCLNQNVEKRINSETLVAKLTELNAYKDELFVCKAKTSSPQT